MNNNIEYVDAQLTFCQLWNINLSLKCSWKGIQIKHRANQAYDTTLQTSVRGTEQLFSVKLPLEGANYIAQKFLKFEKGLKLSG